MRFANLLTLLNFAFAAIIGVYFLGLLRSQRDTKTAVSRESRKELDKLSRMRSIYLTEPLSEKTRPQNFSEIVGQEDGVKLLKAALCGPNPQHILIYGPPGVGKTAAARLVLDEARNNSDSPFGPNSKFIELDATTARFDERGIADPLIGSVHDPIYQGAGPLGIAGIPQPKPGAVTKAHGGILFIDEIGELHPIQINKLLKVLEDRKVFLESAYYSCEDKSVPDHIHDIFGNGLPADFRLVGATTRPPEDIPPAIRSRCLEVYFRELTPTEITKIIINASQKIGFILEKPALKVASKYAKNGREAVNLVQIAAGLARSDSRKEILAKDIEWIVNSSHLSPRPDKEISDKPQIGVAYGMAVRGPSTGVLIEVEVVSTKADRNTGKVKVTGVVEEEEFNGRGHTIRRKSMAKDSVENVLTVMQSYVDFDPRDYNIHINFPGGIPLDGPSAGVTIATAIYSSLGNLPISNQVAMTGELSVKALVKPVGGVTAKIRAARQAGIKQVIIPADNWQESYLEYDGVEVIAVKTLDEVFSHAILPKHIQQEKLSASSTD